ncbi:hypothetical protein CU098_006070 [Rhizopus stolonifer]|uniref:WLM domain-containing protein n=2 Tax=Mucorineae TaxID=1344963 RepID=A0A367JSG2_RHIST|nr:hypothetical protein CU098_006070 [Rhizopus stolonifer]
MNKHKLIDDYQELKRKPKSKEALELLKKLASQVKPILSKHNWKITTLCEFFPENPNLLGINVNRGWQIKLRLRPHYDENQFLEYHDILGTLLHEIVHIVRGPHDEIFYKKLAELQQETEALMTSGYTGEGFYSKGHLLSSSSSVPRYLSNQAAASAAEKRLKMSKWMTPPGGKRLGGNSSHNKHLSPAQLAAQAAQKRLQDKVWCGGSVDNKDQETTNKRRLVDSPVTIGKRSRVTIDLTADDQEENDDWACPTCTYLNNSIVLSCIMCFTERSYTPPQSDVWTCPQCELENEKKWQTCTACAFVYLR